ALQCYTCYEPTDSEKCMKIQNCTKNETMCKTTLYPILGAVTVTRMCASTCIPSNVDGIGMTRPVSCCYTDLWNTDGAASLR
ncbi:LYPD2 protein, partial [Nothoprocta ornata]|nr:LYPD2 protein [Nothoprocta ornata]